MIYWWHFLHGIHHLTTVKQYFHLFFFFTISPDKILMMMMMHSEHCINMKLDTILWKRQCSLTPFYLLKDALTYHFNQKHISIDKEYTRGTFLSFVKKLNI